MLCLNLTLSFVKVSYCWRPQLRLPPLNITYLFFMVKNVHIQLFFSADFFCASAYFCVICQSSWRSQLLLYLFSFDSSFVWEKKFNMFFFFHYSFPQTFFAFILFCAANLPVGTSSQRSQLRLPSTSMVFLFLFCGEEVRYFQYSFVLIFMHWLNFV